MVCVGVVGKMRPQAESKDAAHNAMTTGVRLATRFTEEKLLVLLVISDSLEPAPAVELSYQTRRVGRYVGHVHGERVNPSLQLLGNFNDTTTGHCQLVEGSDALAS